MTSILNNTPGGSEEREKEGVRGERTEGEKGLKRRGKSGMNSVRKEKGGEEESERKRETGKGEIDGGEMS